MNDRDADATRQRLDKLWALARHPATPKHEAAAARFHARKLEAKYAELLKQAQEPTVEAAEVYEAEIVPEPVVVCPRKSFVDFIDYMAAIIVAVCTVTVLAVLLGTWLIILAAGAAVIAFYYFVIGAIVQSYPEWKQYRAEKHAGFAAKAGV